MSNLAIKVDNVSKLYRLGDVGTGTLGDDLTRFWAKMRGKEDPFSKIANSNDRSQKSNSDYVWSLRDIDFEIKKGDAVGIIGRNGAGKSTLLKVLSRITSPTTGRVRIDGRVASLLEVGTGFSPDLTGRQNIYMNGAILGMTRAEVSAKMDEIIDFSGVEGYIDTPVKRYSSGMYVRLAFAVAAHLDPEIMIVDEVLAVGDAEFQKKCLGKMQDVNKGEGRTVLFVSHNMAAIKSLCKSGIFLKNGSVNFAGNISDTIEKYLLDNNNKSDNVLGTRFALKEENTDVFLKEAVLFDKKGTETGAFEISDDIFISLNIQCNTLVPNLYGYLAIKNTQDDVFIETDTNDFLPNILNGMKTGENKYELMINKNTLPYGSYIVYLSFASPFSDKFNVAISGNILTFNVSDNLTTRGHNRKSYTSLLIPWKAI